MIFLDIPQGAIILASAIVVVFASTLVMLMFFLFRSLSSIREGVKGLETDIGRLDVQQVFETNARMEIL